MIQRNHRVVLLFSLVLAMLSAGCAKPIKHYQLSGKVVSTDVNASQLVVDHKDIPGFMSAMTMSYRVKDASVLKTLAPGDEISADVVVQGTNYWLENIRITKKNAIAPSGHVLRCYHAGDPAANDRLRGLNEAQLG